ncbi:hypothetical protein VNI00_004196 [Paramarasmius palmivorus]|uniref:Uncharacterized protein n=1 Tax=Paramarasmius palmivorus TaxID=297713 RepID=A0AAW0DPY8_9AGAR
MFDIDEFFFGKAHYRYDPDLEASFKAYKFGQPAEHQPVQEISPWTPLPRASSSSSSSSKISPSAKSSRASSSRRTPKSSTQPSSSSSQTQTQTQRRKRKIPPTDEAHPFSKRFDDGQKEFLYKFLFVDKL